MVSTASRLKHSTPGWYLTTPCCLFLIHLPVMSLFLQVLSTPIWGSLFWPRPRSLSLSMQLFHFKTGWEQLFLCRPFLPRVSLSSCGGHKCHSPTWWWAATWMVAPTKLACRALSSRLGGALPRLLLLPLPLLATKHLLMLLNPCSSLPEPRWRAAASLKAFRCWGQDAKMVS